MITKHLQKGVYLSTHVFTFLCFQTLPSSCTADNSPWGSFWASGFIDPKLLSKRHDFQNAPLGLIVPHCPKLASMKYYKGPFKA